LAINNKKNMEKEIKILEVNKDEIVERLENL